MERIRTNDRNILEEGARFPLRNEDVTSIEFIGTCASPGIARISEKTGIRFSYPRIVKMIKVQYPSIYHDLALEYYNPWSSNTRKVWHNGHYYLILEHSMIDYVFRVIV